MNYPMIRSRWCNLDKTQMQYVNTIALVVHDIKAVPPQEITKILDHLYLGNFENATDVKALKDLGITHIVNTVDNYYANCVTKKEFYGDGFEYLGFTSDDHESYPIMNHFEEVYKFVQDAKTKGGKCFIHCIAGINRSGCLATACVMLDKNIGPITAAQEVHEARGMLLSNDGFIERLVKFAIERDLLLCDKDKLLPRFTSV